MEDIQIDLMRHKEPAPETLPDIDLAKATLVPQTFAVTGMTCSACVNSVERSLNALPGVSASVNFASETVHIVAPAEVKAEVIIKAIKSAGYGASLLDDQHDPALHRKGAARALFFAAIFAVPTIAISMVMSWHDSIGTWLYKLFTEQNWPLPPHAHHSFTSWLALLLTTPLILIVAFPIHRAAIRNFFHPTMDSLISLGSLSAYSWSIYATYSGEGDVYTEVAAGVLLFVILGRYLEARAKRSASSALSTLLALVEKEVTVLRSGSEVLIPISHLMVGDEFVVKPGARIATDGIVISGISTVDNSLITGESLPIDIAPGSRVVGASLNNNGRIIVRATRVGSDTEMARITAMVVTAQGSKSPIQQSADKIAAIFVPVVTTLSIATFAFWFYNQGKTLTFSISTAITVLVIACPCALGLATPVALLVASGRGALRGIVIRQPRVLSVAREIDAVILDKTGTLTEGHMRIRDVAIPVSAQRVLGTSFENVLTEKNVLSLALALESQNDHPMARSIVEYATSRGAEKLAISDFSQTPGAGVAARISAFGKTMVVIIGSPETVGHSAVALDSSLVEAISRAKDASLTTSLLAVDGVAIAHFTAGDVIKSDAGSTIAALHAKNIQTWLVTGDHQETATLVASQVGISSQFVLAGASPESKIEKVRELQASGHKVMMVGDGVNDAAGLAQADLSIAMGTGTDTAISTADITLMRPQLMGVIEALDLSKRTVRTIKSNLGWAFIYNVIGLPVAALGLMSPMYAAAAMAASSLFVVTNSLRIR
ncbi:MAG: heavy metal translocating P-type ATPase [Candidatus Planktophila sp.]